MALKFVRLTLRDGSETYVNLDRVVSLCRRADHTVIEGQGLTVEVRESPLMVIFAKPV